MTFLRRRNVNSWRDRFQEAAREGDRLEGAAAAVDLDADLLDLVDRELLLFQRPAGDEFVLLVHEKAILQIDGGGSQP